MATPAYWDDLSAKQQIKVHLTISEITRSICVLTQYDYDHPHNNLHYGSCLCDAHLRECTCMTTELVDEHHRFGPYESNMSLNDRCSIVFCKGDVPNPNAKRPKGKKRRQTIPKSQDFLSDSSRSTKDNVRTRRGINDCQMYGPLGIADNRARPKSANLTFFPSAVINKL